MVERGAHEPKSPTRPCWSWSGAEALDFTAPTHELEQLVAMLSEKKSSDDEILAFVVGLRERFQRRLHQDEFGPTRAQQTTALQALTKSLSGFQRHLIKSSTRVKERLDAALKNRASPSDTIPQALYEAASDSLLALRKDQKKKRSDVKRASDLRDSAESLMVQVVLLDTNTESALFDISLKHDFDIAQVTGPVFSLTAADAWLNEFWNVVQRTLGELNARGGAEQRVSLKLLVQELCKLWEDETGLPVAAHGIKRDEYTSRPETEAGYFVLAAVAAMLPPATWVEERIGFAHSKRATTFLPKNKVVRERQVLTIMREFVKHRTERHLPNN